VNRAVERVRKALPINQYLYMCHTGATTGYFPRLDTEGRPLPVDPDIDALSTGQRVDMAQYLIDKVMPAPKYDSEPDAIDVEGVNPELIDHLPSEQLLRLMAPEPDTTDLLEPAFVRAI
jgi:hypothetical protein